MRIGGCYNVTVKLLWYPSLEGPFGVILIDHYTLSILILGLLVKIKYSISSSKKMLTIPLKTLNFFL